MGLLSLHMVRSLKQDDKLQKKMVSMNVKKKFHKFFLLRKNKSVKYSSQDLKY